MASVGGVTCNYVSGQAQALAEEVEVWRVPGIDSYGAQKTGTGDGAFRFRCWRYNTDVVVDAWAAAIRALQATVVTIINDRGDTFTNCLLVRVSTPAISAIVGVNGETTRGELEVMGVRIS